MRWFRVLFFMLFIYVSFESFAEVKDSTDKFSKRYYINAGITFLNIYHYEKFYNISNPYFVNAFYNHSIIMPIISIGFINSKINIHSFTIGHQNYNTEDFYGFGPWPPNLGIANFILSYKFDYNIHKKNKPVSPYFVGLQLCYNNKQIKYSESIPYYGSYEATNKTYKINLNSFLLQLSPSIKTNSGQILYEIGFNLNLLDIVFGKYYYHYTYYTHYKKYPDDEIIIDKKNYIKFVNPIELVNYYYLFNDLFFKIGYIF